MQIGLEPLGVTQKLPVPPPVGKPDGMSVGKSVGNPLGKSVGELGTPDPLDPPDPPEARWKSQTFQPPLCCCRSATLLVVLPSLVTVNGTVADVPLALPAPTWKLEISGTFSISLCSGSQVRSLAVARSRSLPACSSFWTVCCAAAESPPPPPPPPLPPSWTSQIFHLPSCFCAAAV